MRKFIAFIAVIIFLLHAQCRDSDRSKHVAVIYQFDAAEMTPGFLSSLSLAADSLGLLVTPIDAGQADAAANFDTLISHLDAIAAPSVVTNSRLVEIINKKCKSLPMLHFDMEPEARDNYYRVGHKAGRYVATEFGSAGRFGILTSSLSDANANEIIRGFREELMTAKNRWRQVNIVTYEENSATALTQFKRMNRFGARTVWLLTDGNSDFGARLKNYKKNSYFIAADLHANKNSIKLLKEGVIDALTTSDFNNLGERVAVALSSIVLKDSSIRVLPFQSSILSRKNAGIQFE